MIRRLQAFDRDLLLIYLSSFLWGFGVYLYFYVQPLYITQLGATPAQVGLALGLGGFVVTFLYAPIGLWADRRGRKPVILAGWLLGTISGFGMALAPDWRWFVPAYAGYLLSNFAVSVLNGYITAKTTPQARTAVFATMSSTGVLGSIIAPAIGGWIGEHYGLRTVYFCAALIYTLSTLSILLIRPQPAEPQANRASASQLLRDRSFLRVILLVFLLFFAVDVGQVLAPKYLAEVRGYSVNQIGWLGTIGALGVVLLMLSLSKLPGERRITLVVSQTVALLGLLLLLITPAFPVAALAFLIGGGNRLIRPPTVVHVARLLTPATLSFGMGLQMTATQLGLSVSPYVAGLLYAQNPVWPFYAGAIGLSLTLLLTFSLLTSLSTQSKGLPEIGNSETGR